MKTIKLILLLASITLFVACGQESTDDSVDESINDSAAVRASLYSKISVNTISIHTW